MKITRAIQNFRHEYSYNKYYCHSSHARIPTRLEFFLTYIYYSIRPWIGAQICKHKGHKLTDAGSYAGPEGGTEHLECTRCGFTFTNVMY